MSIVKMKRLRLYAMRSQQEELLEKLMLLGCVEISEPEPLTEESPYYSVLKREVCDIGALRAELSELNTALSLLNREVPVKTPMFAPKPTVNAEALFDDPRREAALHLAAKIAETDARRRRCHAGISALQSKLASLAPWKALDTPLNLTETRLCTVLLGTVPVCTDLQELSQTLAAVSPETQLFPVSEDADLKYLQLIYMKADDEPIREALRSSGFSVSPLQAYDGLAAEVMAQTESEMASMAVQATALSAEIAEMASAREELKLAIDCQAACIAQGEAKERLMATESVVTFEGWFSAPEEAQLTALLQSYDCAWEFREPMPDEVPAVPVKLKNNWFTKPLNMVTEMYSLPAYNGVDPNPLMAPFFILFYGIMLADMGYGLLLILAGLLVTKKARPGGMTGYMFSLAISCGISTFLFGALTGGFFGDFIKQLLLIFNPESTFEWFWKPLFTPLDDTIMILLGSLALGLVQILVGMGVSVVEKCKKGDFLGAIFEEGTWTVILAGIACMVLGVGTVAGVPLVLAVGCLMLIIGSARGAKGFGCITAIFSNIYNGVTGYFSDVLSYSRLMALMLSGSVIAQVFNTLGGITGNVVLFVLISLIGNTLNFGLNLLGCFVHDMRLQCLEFFGRFYQDGGKPFAPLSIKTKFVNTANKADN